jgi:hypothetical protein
MMLTCFLGLVTGVVIALALIGQKSAYRNGVTDGYGYAREPHNPGYRKAGAYLRKHMGHRWGELRTNTIWGPLDHGAK